MSDIKKERESFWKQKWEEAAAKSTFTQIYPQAEVCWNHSASTYDLGMGNSLDRVEIVLKELEEHGYTAGTIKNALDIGSGTGNYTIPLARIAESVTALDCAEEMNHCLAQKIYEKKLHNIKIITDDFMQHTFMEGYDLVIGSMNPALYNPVAFEKMIQLCRKVLIYVGIIPQEKGVGSSGKTLEELLFHINLTHGNSNDIRFPYEVLKAKGFDPYIREVDCIWEYSEECGQVFAELTKMYEQLKPCEANWKEILKRYVEEHSEGDLFIRKGKYKLGVLMCDLAK